MRLWERAHGVRTSAASGHAVQCMGTSRKMPWKNANGQTKPKWGTCEPAPDIVCKDTTFCAAEAIDRMMVMVD